MYRKIKEYLNVRSWSLLDYFLLISLAVTVGNSLFLMTFGGGGEA